MKPTTLGDSFQTWPLHVTVIPWFRLPDTTERIVNGLTEAFKTVAPFTSMVDTETLMGPKHNRPVILLSEPTPFRDIEVRSRNYLHKKHAWLVDETTKKRRSFRPHVTIQELDRLHAGEAFATNNIFIVEQKGDYKQVVGEIPLHPYE